MFAEMPLDNRTVNKFAAQTATSGFNHAAVNVTADEDDLMFRRGRWFCNIEPKICQYD
jgi:hypothetical protein